MTKKNSVNFFFLNSYKKLKFQIILFGYDGREFDLRHRCPKFWLMFI